MGVTALASTGDAGDANLESDLSTIYPFPTVDFPAASPLVGAIGGTSLTADTSGNYQSETVWNSGGAPAAAASASSSASRSIRRPAPVGAARARRLPRHPRHVLGCRSEQRILIYLSFLTRPATTGSAARAKARRRGPASSPTSTSSPPPDRAAQSVRVRARRGGRGYHDVTVGNNSLNRSRATALHRDGMRPPDGARRTSRRCSAGSARCSGDTTSRCTPCCRARDGRTDAIVGGDAPAWVRPLDRAAAPELPRRQPGHLRGGKASVPRRLTDKRADASSRCQRTQPARPARRASLPCAGGGRSARRAALG